MISWYVMMGIGQVVTLKFPPAKLRDMNLQIEHGAWGAFHNEFYPTHDYRPMWEASKKDGRLTLGTNLDILDRNQIANRSLQE